MKRSYKFLLFSVIFAIAGVIQMDHGLYTQAYVSALCVILNNVAFGMYTILEKLEK